MCVCVMYTININSYVKIVHDVNIRVSRYVKKRRFTEASLNRCSLVLVAHHSMRPRCEVGLKAAALTAAGAQAPNTWDMGMFD